MKGKNVPIKPTIFFVIDTETSGFNGSVHDFAWIAIDRNGKEYSRGSYFFTEVFREDEKLVKKLADYAVLFDERKISHGSWDDVRDKFNREIGWLQSEGHRVIVAAYNAQFDYDRLDMTEFTLHPDRYVIQHGILKGIADPSLASFVTAKIDWLDIWMQWAKSCPRSYQSEKRTKKGWMQTRAEDVGRFELEPDYIQHHYALADCEGEAKILLRSLARKKALAVNTIFDTFPAKVAHERVTRADLVAA
jgi:hypothetical protein